MSSRKNPPSSKTQLPFLGLACGVGVSTIYYNQPLLLEMGHTFHVSEGKAGFVAVATQVGYAIGLLCFVPMGDIAERRGLMMKLYGAVSVALLLVSLAPTLPLLIAASAIAGALAAVTHIALPIAPDIAPKHMRGRAIGIVMSGLLLGVLLARTFAGWLNDLSHHLFPFASWRTVFFLAALLNAAFVPAMRRYMPNLPPKRKLSYADAMRSLYAVAHDEPLLREAAVTGALVFAAFSCFWNTLAFLLGTHGLGAGVAGTFGLVGTAGALVASFAGKKSDSHGPRWVLTGGLIVFACAYTGLWLNEAFRTPFALHLICMALCVILLDVGMQSVQIANQTRIFALLPEARSRINTVYMVAYFTGGAMGSTLSTIAWEHYRWNGVCILALGLLALALLRHLTGDRTKYKPLHPTDPNRDFVLEG